MSDDRKCVRVRILGRVQGVWFRGWTLRAAGRLGLDGWVRNNRDGSVEAVFAGPAAKVDAMVEHCRSGPPAAKVTAVHQAAFDDEVEPGFHQR
ncbi:MAG: acylphosphatase [Alphaproteobacteria bacterium]|nr:acylphosphatase [Alphaproteobacteria bacterium]